MKNKFITLICHSCGCVWDHLPAGQYPCGPCPTLCPNCKATCCPFCGGEMGKSIDDEMDLYTSGGCYICNYTCCGGCI